MVLGISYTFWGDATSFQDKLGGFDPYYLGIIVFAVLSIYFSFGNIENAKTLQIITTILRFIVTILMCSGSIYFLESSGENNSDPFDFKN